MEESSAQPQSAPPPLPGDPRLTPENLKQLVDAKNGLKKIRRAVSVARFDGWTIAILGTLTLALGFSSFWGLAMGSAMVVIAYVELRNADRLGKLDLSSIKVLALNQVWFASLLIVYAVWSIFTTSVDSISSETGLTELGYSQGQITHLAKMVILAVYGAVILFAICAQGGMALYYVRRRKHLEEYLARTPEWIVAMQKAGISV